jgi:hypothetical protein
MIAAVYGVIAATGALTGLAGVIISSIKHTLAERALKREMGRHTEEVSALEKINTSLENDPDPHQLENARQIVSSLAQHLSDQERDDILRTLDRGSKKSRANYIAKLVEDQAAGSNTPRSA